MKYFILLSFFTTAMAVHGQSVLFSYTDGTQQIYELGEVRKFTFISDSLNLHLTNGIVYSWHLDSMNYYQYQEKGLVTSMAGNTPRTLPSMKVYPNPSPGELTLEYTLDTNMPVNVEIVNMQGCIISQMSLGMQYGGQQSVRWNAIDQQGQSLPSGTYLCSIVTPHIRMSRTFIIY